MPLFQATFPTLKYSSLCHQSINSDFPEILILLVALKLKKVPTQLVLYPRQPHGLVERAHQLDFMKRVVEWFNRYLKIAGTN